MAADFPLVRGPESNERDSCTIVVSKFCNPGKAKKEVRRKMSFVDLPDLRSCNLLPKIIRDSDKTY